MLQSWRHRASAAFAGLLLSATLMGLDATPAHAQNWPNIQSSGAATKVLADFKRGPYGKIAAGRVARETLVTDIYALIDPSGKYGPVFVDAKNKYLKNGASPWLEIASGKSLSAAQIRALKQKMAQSLNTNRAIRFTYGAGKTNAIMVSAYDCPYCRKLEQELDAGGVNATVYVFPMALQTTRPGPMGIARNIWCSAQSDAAWKAMTISKQAPGQAAPTCDKDARQTAELMTLFDIKAVPARIYSDGRVAQFKANAL